MSVKVKWDNFSQQSSERDLGLQVEETVFWVSRRQLADCSPVFNTMLYGEFKESNNDIVKLSEKKPDEILEMLRCLFSNGDQSDGKKPVDNDNVELLLKLGNEYQISDLLASCSNIVKSKFQKSTVEETVGFIDSASRYKLKNVIREGLRRLSEFSAEVLLGNQAFGSLPVNMRYAVSIISLIRLSRPTDHVIETLDANGTFAFEDTETYDEYIAGVCKKHKCFRGEDIYRCHACDYSYCRCQKAYQDSESEKCLVCYHCRMKYGTTDFVCNCVDPLIEAELEKLGL